MLTVAALREIYKTLGGTETDITDVMTIPEALTKINTQLAIFVSAATAKELPTVTVSDAGSVLKVNAQGKWAVGEDAISA